MKKIQKNKITRLQPVICTLSLFAFIATATVTAITVERAKSQFASNTIANAEHIPKTWKTANNLAVVSSVEAEVLANNYVQYSATITNQGDDDTYVTHLSSYLSNAQSEGFIPLGDHNIEYTYKPSDATSWHELEISAPANTASAFTLNSQLYLAPASSVYLRYYVSPESNVTDLTDKMAVLLTDTDGNTGYAEAVATLDYADTVAKMSASTKSSPVLSSGDPDGTYAEPLGVFSFTPNITATTSTIAKTTGIDDAFLQNGFKAILVFFLAIILCIAMSLFLRQPKKVSRSYRH